MRIAMLSIHSSPLARLGGKEAGGMNVYVRELARTLGQQQIAVDVFTRQQAPDLANYIDVAPGVRLVHVPAGPLQPYDKTLILDHLDELTNNIRAFAHTQRITYNLMHSHYFVSGAAALALRQHWHIPVVQMFHTLGAMKNHVARSTAETETARRVEVERRVIHEAEAIVAATPADRDQMVTHYHADPQRIQIIPCGVDSTFFQPQPQATARTALGLPHTRQLVLCVGRMEPLKGMDALIRAAALLHTQQPTLAEQVQVILIGGEPADRQDAWNAEQVRLSELCAALGVDDMVLFAGSQPHTALPNWYNAADVLVMPSHYESFGMVALEAMACGVPVVASAVGGLTTLIEDGTSGVLVPPDTPHLLAHALQRLLQDVEQAASMGQAARQRALHYAWGNVAQTIRRLYIDLRA